MIRTENDSTVYETPFAAVLYLSREKMLQSRNEITLAHGMYL